MIDLKPLFVFAMPALLGALVACSSAPPRAPCHPADEMECLPPQAARDVRHPKVNLPPPAPPRVPGPR